MKTGQLSTRNDGGGLQSVIKSFALVEALVDAGEANAATLAEELGEPRSSVYRMLATLQQIGVVEPGSRRGLHRPGLGLVRLGGLVLTRFDERQLLLPVLQSLRAQTKETVHLALRRGNQAVFIERLQGESTHALAIKLGGVLPLHVGASPRALLAFEPDRFWDEYFTETVIEAPTQSAPATEAEVREMLVEIRRTGVSISDGDVVPGVATVGAPVFDHRGVIRAAIAFNLLPGALHDDRAGWIGLARTASAAASLTFGYDLDEKGLPTIP